MRLQPFLVVLLLTSCSVEAAGTPPPGVSAAKEASAEAPKPPGAKKARGPKKDKAAKEAEGAADPEAAVAPRKAAKGAAVDVDEQARLAALAAGAAAEPVDSQPSAAPQESPKRKRPPVEESDPKPEGAKKNEGAGGAEPKPAPRAPRSRIVEINEAAARAAAKITAENAEEELEKLKLELAGGG